MQKIIFPFALLLFSCTVFSQDDIERTPWGSMFKKTVLSIVKPWILLASLVVFCNAASAQDDIKRTPWGKPDLNGYWDYHHLTPLQRPAQFEGSTVMTEEQAKDWEDNAYNREAERRGRSNPNANYVGVDLWHEEAFAEWETDDHRTSLITDPPSGRIPAMLESRREERANRPRYRGYPRG
ncbi:MAG: hypothetical protein QGF90_04030, partial [Gammaproteobacteria bacterium]|nr:hypothetical protein [Gammaproteobacteria bacterium]